VSLGVFNLLDAHYGYPAGGEFLQDVLEADGRTARLKCTYGF
jgi:hypothetical protein